APARPRLAGLELEAVPPVLLQHERRGERPAEARGELGEQRRALVAAVRHRLLARDLALAHGARPHERAALRELRGGPALALLLLAPQRALADEEPRRLDDLRRAVDRADPERLGVHLVLGLVARALALVPAERAHLHLPGFAVDLEEGAVGAAAARGEAVERTGAPVAQQHAQARRVEVAARRGRPAGHRAGVCLRPGT